MVDAAQSRADDTHERDGSVAREIEIGKCFRDRNQQAAGSFDDDDIVTARQRCQITKDAQRIDSRAGVLGGDERCRGQGEAVGAYGARRLRAAGGFA